MCNIKKADPPKYEVADVMRKYGYVYLKRGTCNTEQYHVLSRLQSCRTPALGGRQLQCPNCRYQEMRFNSCRNRHCPKCQFQARQKWLQKQIEDLLPVSYYHFVATLPHQLNPWIKENMREMIGLFFRTINLVMQAFAEDPQWRLEGELGLLSVLHTWNQKMGTHYHIHNLIPAGVLQKDGTWKAGREGFLFKKSSLAKAIRNAYLVGLSRMYKKGKLQTPNTPNANLPKLIEKLKVRKWVVYIKRPFGGPEAVLKYLGGYTHRVAISNHRILAITQDSVTFTYLDRRDKKSKPIRKRLTVKGPDFIAMFLTHVLPSGFQKIRYYGIMGSRLKKEKLAQIRSQCQDVPEERKISIDEEPAKEEISEESCTGPVCPHCEKEIMVTIEEIPKQRVLKLPLESVLQKTA